MGASPIIGKQASFASNSLTFLERYYLFSRTLPIIRQQNHQRIPLVRESTNISRYINGVNMFDSALMSTNLSWESTKISCYAIFRAQSSHHSHAILFTARHPLSGSATSHH
jgi:hypothetical protein